MMLFAFEHASRGGERGPHFLFPFLFFLLLGWIAFRVIRRKKGGGWHSHGSPLQTLQDRFARGEIGQEEFEHRKAVLVGADVVPPAPQPFAPPPAPTPEQPDPAQESGHEESEQGDPEQGDTDQGDADR